MLRSMTCRLISVRHSLLARVKVDNLTWSFVIRFFARQPGRIYGCRSRLGDLFTSHGQQDVESRSVSEHNHVLVLANDLEALAPYQIGLEDAVDCLDVLRLGEQSAQLLGIGGRLPLIV